MLTNKLIQANDDILKLINIKKFPLSTFKIVIALFLDILMINVVFKS